MQRSLELREMKMRNAKQYVGIKVGASDTGII